MAEQTTRGKDASPSSLPVVKDGSQTKQLRKGAEGLLFKDPNALSAATRSKLEYGRGEYCRTSHHQAALQSLQRFGSVTLAGPQGAGKTALASELLRQAYHHQGAAVLAAESPRDVQELFRKSREEDAGRKTLVLVDAIFGESAVDETSVESWQETLVEVDLRLKLQTDSSRGHVFQFIFTTPSVVDGDVEAEKLVKAQPLVRLPQRTVELSVWGEEDRRAVFLQQAQLWRQQQQQQQQEAGDTEAAVAEEEVEEDLESQFQRVASANLWYGWPLTCRAFFRQQRQQQQQQQDEDENANKSLEKFFSSSKWHCSILENILKTDPEGALLLTMVIFSDNQLDEKVFPSRQPKAQTTNGTGGEQRSTTNAGVDASKRAGDAPSSSTTAGAPNEEVATSLLSRIQRRLESGVRRLRAWFGREPQPPEEWGPWNPLDMAQLFLSLDLQATPAVEERARALVRQGLLLAWEGGRLFFRHSLFQDAMVTALHQRDRETLSSLCSERFFRERVVMTEGPQLRRRGGRCYFDPALLTIFTLRLADFISWRKFSACRHPNMADPEVAGKVFSILQERRELKEVLTSEDAEGQGSFLACCVHADACPLFTAAFRHCRGSRRLRKKCLQRRQLSQILQRCCIYDNVEAYDAVDEFLGTKSFRDTTTDTPGVRGLVDAMRQLMRLGVPDPAVADGGGDSGSGGGGGGGGKATKHTVRDSGEEGAEESWDLYCGEPCCQTLVSLAVLHRSHRVLERMVCSYFNTLSQAQTRDALYLACATNNPEAFAIVINRPLGVCRYPLVQLISRAGAGDVMQRLLSTLDEIHQAEAVVTAATAGQGEVEVRGSLRESLDFVDARGRGPLMVAAHNGHARLVEIVLPHSDPNARDESSGATALMLAAFRGFSDVVDVLLPASDASLADAFGRTALHMAAARGHVQTVKSLLAASDPLQTNADGDTALAIAACYRQDDVVEVLLPVSEPSRANGRGRTALHLAAMHGHASTVSLLVPVSDVNRTTEQGRTALQLAATSGHAEVVRILLEASSDPNLTCSDGMNALELAAIQGHSKVVEVLLPVTDLTHSDGDGNTALHLAAYFGHADTVRALLPACDPSLGDKEGRTPLHVAATHGYDQIVRLLLPASDPLQRDAAGETALALAVKFSHRAAVETLLPVSDANLSNHLGQTPLHLAALGGHLEIAQLLLPASDASRLDSHGNTALSLAFQASGSGGSSSSSNQEQMIQLLLPHTDPSLAAGDHRMTPLHMAAECRLSSVQDVQTLAQKGGDPQGKDVVGRTPLHLAAWGGREDVVKALLPISEDPAHSTDDEGRTPLHLAAFCGHAGCVRLLLPASDPLLPDLEGNTPLHLAAMRGHAQVVSLLLPPGSATGQAASLEHVGGEKTREGPDADEGTESTQKRPDEDGKEVGQEGSSDGGTEAAHERSTHGDAEAAKEDSTQERSSPALADTGGDAATKETLPSSEPSSSLTEEKDASVPDPARSTKQEEDKEELAAAGATTTESSGHVSADPLLRNKEGLTALELASRAGHADVIAQLLPLCRGEAAWSAWQLALRHHPGSGSAALGVFHGFVPQKRQPPSPPPASP